MATRTGSIGLGNMGYGMASNIRKNLPPTQTFHIHDISEETCKRFVQENSHYGPIVVESCARDLAAKCKTIVSMVPADEHVQAAYFDPSTGIIAAPQESERLMLECSTIDIQGSQENSKKIKENGSGTYVDCPVSGGVWAAGGGYLSFMVGHTPPSDGDPLAQRILDTLLLMGDREKIRFCGAIGFGLVAKIAANYICISNLLVAAEGMALGVNYGIDRKILWDTIQDGAGQSWVMHYEQPVPGLVDTAPSTHRYRRAFAARLGLKDLRIGVKAAKSKGINPTAGALAIEAFQKVDADPRTTDLDHSSIYLHVSDQLDAFEKGQDI